MTIINFPSILTDLTSQLSGKVIDEVLTIEKTPSIKSSLNLLMKPWFRSRFYTDSSIGIVIKVDDFKEEKIAIESIDFKDDRPLLVAFEAPTKLAIYWKPAGSQFSSFCVTDESFIACFTPFFIEFIIQEIKIGRSGKF